MDDTALKLIYSRAPPIVVLNIDPAQGRVGTLVAALIIGSVADIYSEAEAIMKNFVVRANVTEEWVTLVNEAEAAAAHSLDEDMESYLVFLLIRFTEKPELADSVLALDYLRSMQLSGHLAQDQLRDVGDKCLLYSGLFPERATRRRVQVSYFVDLGRGAYQQLAERLGNSAADLYQRLAATFVSLMDILQAMRELGQPPQLDPLQAYELWRDTGSSQALKTLRLATRATPLIIPGKNGGRHH